MRYRALLLSLFAPTVFAYPPDQAKANLASDFAVCAAYYTLMKEAPHPEMKDNPQVLASAKASWDLAVSFSNEDTTKARMQLATKSMISEMKNDWTNFAVLINKYAYDCKSFLERPTERFQYWLQKR
jgi:hypothetical protein